MSYESVLLTKASGTETICFFITNVLLSEVSDFGQKFSLLGYISYDTVIESLARYSAVQESTQQQMLVANAQLYT